MVVSIHAIATFQALNDYLRPRITGLMSTGGLSGMLAALAASGFGPTASRNPPETPTPPSKPVESSSAPKAASETPATGSLEVGRRRSLRLSAKNGGSSVDGGGSGTTTVPTGAGPIASSSFASVPQPTAQRVETLIQDNGLVSDFTDDDEVDAEVISITQAYSLGANYLLSWKVFEDEDDIDSAADKTVTLSIADGKPVAVIPLWLSHAQLFSDGSKVEAQTPDGTRVATPSTAPLTSPSRNANKVSYAAALKTKPSDWHLEFSMDDHLLPLDLTIYGAIHQHEIRKKLGPVPSSSMWQGIYTVKFKKMNGPPASQEGKCR